MTGQHQSKSHTNGEHVLPELPFEKHALEPHISRETIEYHYEKHHAGYVKKLNAAVQETAFQNSSLTEIVMNASGALYDNAAQVWNHTFYWNCMTPVAAEPPARLRQALDENFGSVEAFKAEFTETAMKNFGSGWTWLVKAPDGKLQIVNTDDAGNPLTDGLQPLLTCDVWEHAYYIDYRNERIKYLHAFWNVVNWEFVRDIYTGEKG